MMGPLADEKRARELPPLLDTCGGARGWHVQRAMALGSVALRCIHPLAEIRCAVADVLPELDALAGRQAIRRAGRGEEYDPVTGKLVKKS